MRRSRPSGPPSRSSDAAVSADVRPRAVAGPVWSAGGAPRRAAVQRRGPSGRAAQAPGRTGSHFGGLAVYVAFLISLALTFEFRQDVLGLILGGTLMVMLGLIDDFGVLKPWPKLVGQLIAVFVLIRSGIRIEIAAFPDWLDLSPTVRWMIGIINAVNIIDLMDGLAGGVSWIACFWLFVLALGDHDNTVAVLLAALAGGPGRVPRG